MTTSAHLGGNVEQFLFLDDHDADGQGFVCSRDMRDKIVVAMFATELVFPQ